MCERDCVRERRGKRERECVWERERLGRRYDEPSVPRFRVYCQNLGAHARVAPGVQRGRMPRISHQVFLKSFCKGQSPHKSVNLFCVLVKMKDK